MRTTWHGTISFGLVSVPVGLAVSQDRDSVGFRQIHRGCGERIRLVKTCPTHGPLEADDVAKGYEHDGAFLEVEDADLLDARPDSSRTIAVRCFVDRAEVQPGVLDRTYFLVPSKEPREREGYALLVEAMERTNTAAIAEFVLWGRENLAAVRAQEGRLMLDTLYRPEDLRSPAPVDSMLDGVLVDEDMASLAVQLIEAQREPWDHGAHRSTYNDDLRAMLDAKARGKAPKRRATKKDKPPGALLDALKASLAESGAVEAKRARRPAKARAKT